MSASLFVQAVTDTLWRPEALWVAGLVALLALASWRRMSGGRRALAHTLGFFLLCAVGLLAAAAAQALGYGAVSVVLRQLGVLGVGLVLIRLTGFVVFRTLLPAMGFLSPRILEDILIILGYIVLGMVRLRLSGVDLSGIVTTSAVITAVIAFSMQDTLGNILGGLALQLDSSVSIGDWIRVDDVSGRVADIRWRYTAVLTRNGETVVIPNSQLMKGKFFVAGARGADALRVRRTVGFGVGYEVQPGRVAEVVERALADADIYNVLKEPAPACLLVEFAAGYGRYALRYWLTDPQPDEATDAAVRAHILAALQRAGIRLAVPEERHHVTTENEAYRRGVDEREVARRLRALQGVEIFSVLSPQELTAMAQRLTYAPFARGATITRQGAVAHWLYILVAGEADIFLEAGPGQRTLLTTLSAGQVFGEMGLMTGEPRRATVVARADVECYRLDKAGFEDVIRSRPAIAEQMARILATRYQELEAARDQVRTRTAETAAAPKWSDILGRMRSFFGLS